MTTENSSDQLDQNEKVELISGIPFSTGPFKIKSGSSAKPSKGNLYLTKTMRRFVIDGADMQTGTVVIGGKSFKIRYGRHSADDGRLRNILHPDDVAAIQEFLDSKLKNGDELQEQTGVEFYFGEFKTKKGARFPEGRTIYATKKLRTTLGIDGKTGGIEIEGKKYKVRQAKKPVDGDDFVNILHPVEEQVVQKYLLEKLKQTGEIRSDVNAGVGNLMNQPSITKTLLQNLETRKSDSLIAAQTLLDSSTFVDEEDRNLLLAALDFIKDPLEELEAIQAQNKAVAAIIAGYMMQGIEEYPPELNVVLAHLYALQCTYIINHVEEALLQTSFDPSILSIEIRKAEGWAKTLVEFDKDDSFLVAFNELQTRVDSLST